MKNPKDMSKEEMEAVIKEGLSAQKDQGSDVKLNPDELDAVAGGKVSEQAETVVLAAILLGKMTGETKETIIQYCVGQTSRGGLLENENPLAVLLYIDQKWDINQ